MSPGRYRQFRTVKVWLGRLAKSSGKNNLSIFSRWMRWLKVEGGSFRDYSPDDLIRHQKEFKDYDLIDVLQSHVLGYSGTAVYKWKIYTTIRSFFMHNRAELPFDRSFKVQGDRPPVTGDLTHDEIRRVLEVSNIYYRTIFLGMFSGGMGWSEFDYWNRNGLESTIKQIRAGVESVKVDLPGRKEMRYVVPFYTLIGGDALEALRVWFDARPLEAGPYIFTSQQGTPINYQALSQYWRRKLHRLSIINRKPLEEGEHPGSRRYGKHLHELRDVFKTRWHRSGADIMVADFIMGHNIDRNGYDKLMRELDYTRREYRRAQRWLSIATEDPEKIHVDEVLDLRRDIEELKKAVNSRYRIKPGSVLTKK